MMDGEFLHLNMWGINNRPPNMKRSLVAAIRHNHRLIKESFNSNIDPACSHKNITIFSKEPQPEDIAQRLNESYGLSGFKLKREFSTVAAEFVFSLKSESSVANMEGYFRECTEWAESVFSGTTLSSVIHRDEDNPHCHVIVALPLDGITSGSKLIGYKKELSERRKEFFEKVGKPHGLQAPPPPMSSADRKRCVVMLHSHLRATNDPVLQSPGRAAFLELMGKNPAAFMREYGLELPQQQKAAKTFEQIATSTGKGKKTESSQTQDDRKLVKRVEAIRSQAKDDRTTIGVLQTPPESPPKGEHLCSVVILCPQATSTPSETVQPQPRAAVSPPDPQTESDLNLPEPAEYTRVRESDLDASNWDSETGEMRVQPVVAVRTQFRKTEATAWVAGKLAALGGGGGAAKRPVYF